MDKHAASPPGSSELPISPASHSASGRRLATGAATGMPISTSTWSGPNWW